MFLAGFAAMILLAGCGGGGGDTPQAQVAPSGPVSVLAWTPPTTYNDNVVLDPERDLEYYEIYVRQDTNFTDSDLPEVQLAAVTAGTPVTEFTLELIPSLPTGGQLFVSIRAVGVDQQKSAFMAPLTWDRS
jgi:hypothetical protein